MDSSYSSSDRDIVDAAGAKEKGTVQLGALSSLYGELVADTCLQDAPRIGRKRK
jgi:hypothetical protein